MPVRTVARGTLTAALAWQLRAPLETGRKHRAPPLRGSGRTLLCGSEESMQGVKTASEQLQKEVEQKQAMNVQRREKQWQAGSLRGQGRGLLELTSAALGTSALEAGL